MASEGWMATSTLAQTKSYGAIDQQGIHCKPCYMQNRHVKQTGPRGPASSPRPLLGWPCTEVGFGALHLSGRHKQMEKMEILSFRRECIGGQEGKTA